MSLRKSSSLPPNFDALSPEEQRMVEEELYKHQLKWTHGYRPGDPCLTSLSSDGVPLSGSFGAAVEQEKQKDFPDDIEGE